jgi:hypothetical protein
MLPHLYGNLCDFEICDFESFGNKNRPFSTYEQFKLETDNDQEWIEVPDQIIQQRKLLRAYWAAKRTKEEEQAKKQDDDL